MSAMCSQVSRTASHWFLTSGCLGSWIRELPPMATAASLPTIMMNLFGELTSLQQHNFAYCNVKLRLQCRDLQVKVGKWLGKVEPSSNRSEVGFGAGGVGFLPLEGLH